MSTQRKPDDVLTARDLAEQYGLAPRVAESIVRSLLRQGKGVPSPIRRKLGRCVECGKPLNERGVCPTVQRQRDAYDRSFARYVRTGEAGLRPIGKRP